MSDKKDDKDKKEESLLAIDWFGPEMTDADREAWLKQGIFVQRPYVPVIITDAFRTHLPLHHLMTTDPRLKDHTIGPVIDTHAEIPWTPLEPSPLDKEIQINLTKTPDVYSALGVPAAILGIPPRPEFKIDMKPGVGFGFGEIDGMVEANPTLPVCGWDGDGTPVCERITLDKYVEQAPYLTGNNFIGPYAHPLHISRRRG